MKREPRGGTVIVVAQEPMYAARVEAALHDLTGWRIHVCRAGQLRAMLRDCPQAIVATGLAEVETRRVLRAMHAASRGAVLIALSDRPARLWTSAARALGLRAVLPLTARPEEIDAAVRAVHAGLFVVHPEAVAPSAAGDAGAGPGAPLTAREREILELMAEGANNRIIAARLAISRHTVKFHVASILAKLGAGSRTEAVALALRSGLFAV
jgi:DNA-binding NarL/FixJ family response regulator